MNSGSVQWADDRIDQIHAGQLPFAVDPGPPVRSSGKMSVYPKSVLAVRIVVGNYPDFDDRSFTPEASDFNRRPGWIRFVQISEANFVEKVKMITQTYMIRRHFNN